MNRQYCILVYSANSTKCKKLFEYIESLPFDLLSTTGMALCCADNTDMRKTMEACGVDCVPTMLTKYFNQDQQQLVGDEIYDWIKVLAKRMGYKEEEESDENVSITQPQPQPLPSEVGVMARAMNMQKARDVQMGINKKSE